MVVCHRGDTWLKLHDKLRFETNLTHAQLCYGEGCGDGSYSYGGCGDGRYGYGGCVVGGCGDGSYGYGGGW